jgi:hypothetical protein
MFRLHSCVPSTPCNSRSCSNIKSIHNNWKDVHNQRTFFDQLAVKLNIKNPQDWFNVTLRTIQNEGAYFVTRYYNSSLIQGKYHSSL